MMSIYCGLQATLTTAVTPGSSDKSPFSFYQLPAIVITISLSPRSARLPYNFWGLSRSTRVVLMPNGPMTNTIHRRFLGQLGNGVAAYQPWISRRLNTAVFRRQNYGIFCEPARWSREF
ncbi:hypothetical protein WG66_009033 [Moniliophthora roreri]|nr:hypothetical protein WG66_009033 [Moniliophthora roreri]